MHSFDSNVDFLREIFLLKFLQYYAPDLVHLHRLVPFYSVHITYLIAETYNLLYHPLIPGEEFGKPQDYAPKKYWERIPM